MQCAGAAVQPCTATILASGMPDISGLTVELGAAPECGRGNLAALLQSLLKWTVGASHGRAMPYHFARRFPATNPEPAMSKEQRATKNTKKPKKDAAVPKAAGSDRPTPPVTSVAPKGKLAKKPA
jgi:hypothetical protein